MSGVLPKRIDLLGAVDVQKVLRRKPALKTRVEELQKRLNEALKDSSLSKQDVTAAMARLVGIPPDGLDEVLGAAVKTVQREWDAQVAVPQPTRADPFWNAIPPEPDAPLDAVAGVSCEGN